MDKSINHQKIILEYFNAISSLSKTGLGLSGRIMSCISILRNIENKFFEPNNPLNFLNELIDSEVRFIDGINKLSNILSINNIDAIKKETFDYQDDLHISLFNKTWETLRLSSDPLNDYKPYIELIEQRLSINGLENSFFKDKRCLDVGCGTGRFSIVMGKMGGVVSGIDPGPKSVDQASKLINLLNIKNVTYNVGNAYDLQFEDNTFDFVVCNGVLHHLDQPIKALKEIFRVLKKGGHFWLYIEGNGGIYHDIWDGIQKSFIGTSISEVFNILEALRIPNMHFWMDIFFAKYHFISREDNEKRLMDIGFKKLRTLKGATKQDIALELFQDDKYSKLKFGDGGIRILAEK